MYREKGEKKKSNLLLLTRKPGSAATPCGQRSQIPNSTEYFTGSRKQRVYWHLIPKASENPKDESCVTDDGYQDPPLVTYFHAEQWDLLRRLTKENQIESTVQFCSQSAIRIFNTEHQHNDSKVFQDVSSSASEEELGNLTRRTISRSTSSHLHIHLHNNPSENLYCRKTYAKILNSLISFYSKLKVLRGINNH